MCLWLFCPFCKATGIGSTRRGCEQGTPSDHFRVSRGRGAPLVAAWRPAVHTTPKFFYKANLDTAKMHVTVHCIKELPLGEELRPS